MTLSVASGSAVTVNYATSDGSATAGTGYGNDYTETTGMLTFAAGETRKSINVPLRNDDIYEGEESFTVGLNNAMGTVTMSRATATGSIEDDEEFPVLSIVDLRMDEGDAAGDMIFTVRLAPASEEPVRVEIFEPTGIGTARADEDYRRFGRETLRFAPGDTRQTFTIRIWGDDLVENDETIVVRLENPVGALVSCGRVGEPCIRPVVKDRLVRNPETDMLETVRSTINEDVSAVKLRLVDARGTLVNDDALVFGF